MGPELKLLHLPSRKGPDSAIRSKKFVVPDCKVPGNDGHLIDGPCKRGAVRDWTKCDHGAPTREELRLAGWESREQTITAQSGSVYRQIFATPSYFERSYDTKFVDVTEKQDDGSILVKGQNHVRTLVIRPRILEVSASVRNSSGIGPAIAELSGAMEPERFGIAPFCEYFGCMEQQNLTHYRNGWFCNEMEAKLVHADENGTILALDYGEASSLSRRIRAEQLESINV